MKAKLRKGAAFVFVLLDGIDLLLQRCPVRVGIKACVRLLEIVDDQRDARGAVLSQQRVHEGICGGLRFCHTVFFGCLARIHAVRIIDDQHDVGGRLIIFALNTERDLPCVFLSLDSGSAFAELDRALFGPDGLLTVVCEDASPSRASVRTTMSRAASVRLMRFMVFPPLTTLRQVSAANFCVL